MKRVVYMQDEHLLIIYQFSKVVLAQEKFKDLGSSYAANVKKSHPDNALNKKENKNDSNLSLNSTPNSKMETNSDWEIQEKGSKILINLYNHYKYQSQS